MSRRRRRQPHPEEVFLDLVAGTLEGVTHKLITAYARHRRSGRTITQAIRSGADDVSLATVGVSVSALLARPPKRRVVLRKKPGKNGHTTSPTSAPDRDLERVAQLKKILDAG